MTSAIFSFFIKLSYATHVSRISFCIHLYKVHIHTCMYCIIHMHLNRIFFKNKSNSELSVSDHSLKCRWVVLPLLFHLCIAHSSFFLFSQGIKALVTGGGSGLGSATVRRFLDQGAKVVICDLTNTDHVDSVGKDCIFHKTDVS